MKIETWINIKGYEGMYQVSNLGRVKSLQRYRKNYSKLQPVPEKIKSPYLKGNGYLFTQLYKDGKSRNFYIHRLVACAFIKDYSDSLQVNHIDMDKQNNNVVNLEMVTNRENHIKAHKFRGRKRGAYKHYDKFRAVIQINNKTKHLGTFKTKDEAYDAYYREYLKLYGIVPWS